MYIAAGLYTDTLASGSTANTYDASPQADEAIDSWNGGRIIPRRIGVLINVGAISTTGSLAISLRDAASQVDNSTGDAGTALVCELTPITAVGMYYAEIDLNHVFPDTTDAQSYIRRYHSIRAVATDANFEFGVTLCYVNMDRKPPSQDATELTVAYNDPS